MNKRAVLLALAILGACVIALYVALPIPRTFDSQLWKNCHEQSVRYAMVRDFLKRYRVVGMPKDELLQLLGKPDGESDTKLSWDLGRHFGADDSAIDFKVQDTKIVSFDIWGH